MFKLVDKGNGYVQIKAKKGGKCIDVAGRSKDKGANIQQWRCHSGSNQQFKLD